MKVKAKIGFSGVISMGIGQVGEIEDKELLSDLLQAGYVEEVKAEKFFDSDIPRTLTAEMALNYGDKSATVKLSDTEKAKKEIMDSLGLNEEMAETAIDSGTTAMSFKQESKLQEFGFDTENLTRKDADYLLDKISKNHWEVPSDIKPSDYVPFADRADNKVDTSINFDIPTNNDSSNSVGIRR